MKYFADEFAVLLTFIIVVIMPPGNTTNFTYQSDGDTYWKSINPFYIKDNQTYGTITSRTAIYVRFKIEIHDNASENKNIFRIGTTHDISDCDTELPSLWIDENRRFQIIIQDKQNACQGLEYTDQVYTVQSDTIYDITIHFNQQWIYHEINRTIIYNQTRTLPTTSQTLGSILSIRFSLAMKDVPVIDAILSDIIIISYDQSKPFPQSLIGTDQDTVTQLPFTDNDKAPNSGLFHSVHICTNFQNAHSLNVGIVT